MITPRQKVSRVIPHLFALHAALPDSHQRDKIEEMLFWAYDQPNNPNVWLVQVRQIVAQVARMQFGVIRNRWDLPGRTQGGAA